MIEQQQLTAEQQDILAKIRGSICNFEVDLFGDVDTVIYFDPEDLYLYSGIADSTTKRCFHNIDRLIISIKSSVIVSTLRSALLDYQYDLLYLAESFVAVEWDEHNHVGVWSEATRIVEDQNEVAPPLFEGVSKGVDYYWPPEDWFAEDIDQVIDQYRSGMSVIEIVDSGILDNGDGGFCERTSAIEYLEKYLPSSDEKEFT